MAIKVSLAGHCPELKNRISLSITAQTLNRLRTSIVQLFADEFSAHLSHGSCPPHSAPRRQSPDLRIAMSVELNRHDFEQSLL
jgi:hypothetical protein